MYTSQPDEIRRDAGLSNNGSQSDPDNGCNQDHTNTDIEHDPRGSAVGRTRETPRQHQGGPENRCHKCTNNQPLASAHLFGTNAHPNFVDYAVHRYNSVQACPTERRRHPGDSDHHPNIRRSVGFDASKGKARISSHYQLSSIAPYAVLYRRVRIGLCITMTNRFPSRMIRAVFK